MRSLERRLSILEAEAGKGANSADQPTIYVHFRDEAATPNKSYVQSAPPSIAYVPTRYGYTTLTQLAGETDLAFRDRVNCQKNFSAQHGGRGARAN